MKHVFNFGRVARSKRKEKIVSSYDIAERLHILLTVRGSFCFLLI
jgi:hypothetical protein